MPIRGFIVHLPNSIVVARAGYPHLLSIIILIREPILLLRHLGEYFWVWKMDVECEASIRGKVCAHAIEECLLVGARQHMLKDTGGAVDQAKAGWQLETS